MISFLKSRAISKKQFVIVYPDRSKKHIGRIERDSLLLQALVEPVSANEYRYIGQPFTLHSFADLGGIKDKLYQPIGEVRRYLGIHCIFDLRGKRRTEHEESPEGLAIRLQTA